MGSRAHRTRAGSGIAALLLLAAAALAGGCGRHAATPPDAGPRVDPGPSDPGEIDAGLGDGACRTSSTSTVAVPTAVHVPQGSPLSWNSNPPVGGPHYPEWLHWARRFDVVERGNYVHNEEHGGVILINPCMTGCDAVSDALERIGRSLPQDPLCASPINARWVVVRDPLLPPGTAVAAAAWGHPYTSTCFDEADLLAFVSAHYARAPEDTCADGSRP